jgi:Spy/CpxP family protein refolding chaperone
MTYKKYLAALLLSTAFISLPCLSGAAYAHGHEGSDKSASSMECRYGRLTETQRKLLHETMHRLHETNKKAFENMHKLHESLHRVLTADTFDKKAFLSVTADIQAKRAELETSRVQAFASIAGQFTPEQRKHLMRMFAHHRHHHHGMRHRGGWQHGEGHEGWNHEGWEHHERWPQGGMSGNSPTTVGQYNRNTDYPPYAPR